MDGINIQPGDTFKVTKDLDGYQAIKIMNTVWVEEPSWLTIGHINGDQRRQLDELIHALQQLRDSSE
ncbi:hypothetical protein ACTXJX_17400 [Glutamicibacter ardleyensis]|uniref:hypothetical protein n=1 Tax=Glutamicibacter ardleyensis TaxID=225894 RepID=UPI003FCFAB77